MISCQEEQPPSPCYPQKILSPSGGPHRFTFAEFELAEGSRFFRTRSDAESILKPNASISQGFATTQVQTKEDKSYIGFVTKETADKLVLRNITGQAFTVQKPNIASRKELETSMMPTGLVNALSYEEFASLVEFLSKQVK